MTIIMSNPRQFHNSSKVVFYGSTVILFQVLFAES